MKGEESRSSTTVPVPNKYMIDQVITEVLKNELLYGTVAASKVKVMHENENGIQETVPRNTLVRDLKTTTLSSPLLFVVEEEGM